MRALPLALKTALLALLVALVPASAIAMYVLYAEPVLDDRLCRKTAQPPAAHVVLLDRTDPLPGPARESLRLTLERLLDGLPRGARLKIYEVRRDEVGPAATLLFDRCHPGDGRDASRLVNNLRRLQERYQREFVRPLATVLDALATDTTAAARTPLLQALYQVITDPDFSTVTGPRMLWLFSDTVEYSDRLTMYGQGAFHFDAVRDWEPVAGVSDTLKGASVRVRQITTARPNVNPRSLAQFWQQYWRLTAATTVDRSTL